MEDDGQTACLSKDGTASNQLHSSTLQPFSTMPRGSTAEPHDLRAIDDTEATNEMVMVQE